MSDIILKAENISKQYRLGLVGTGTLTHDLNRLWHRLRGKEDPYLKVGAVNDRSAATSSDYVWALQNINFEVKRGEILGIIGKNGAGKSTLLKILSRVTSPTTGSIKTKGRIASLLEVGTGMHPELTGRENIFLNGAILGMNKTEISSKIDEIIEFSGCQMYIDTPVKRYSSGMRVRLGFAVAAFLEPDILVVDEVLAVGDAEFQKKAIGKMQDISNTKGRTVLFVSHNMASVRKLCTRGVILNNGLIDKEGNIDEIVEHYLKSQITSFSTFGVYKPNTKSETPFQLDKVSLTNSTNKCKGIFKSDEDITVTIEYTLESPCRDIRLNMSVLTGDEINVFTTTSHDDEKSIRDIGSYKAVLKIPKDFLNQGYYQIKFNVDIPNVKFLFNPQQILEFKIEKLTSSGSRFNQYLPGITSPVIKWNINDQ
jgi:lipopolysaccharide transport system ATP-binding protein